MPVSAPTKMSHSRLYLWTLNALLASDVLVLESELPVLLRVSVVLLVLLRVSDAEEVRGKGPGVYVIN